MNTIEEHLCERLKGTFKQYVRHAIKHALSEKESENDILQVIVNIQASLELLSKYYVLRKEGWKGIVDSQFHEKTESEVLLEIENGTIKTTAYWKNKDFISDEIYLNDDDKKLLNNFQKYRNQVMHLGIINPSKNILYESIWLVVRIINQLNWQDMIPINKQYMSNTMEMLLGESLYDKLISNSCYVDESVDRANELYDDIKICIQCGNESWVLDEEEYRYCLVCGYKGDEGAFGFIDCPECKSSGALVYDPLNISSNTYLDGKCCACHKIIPVSQCSECQVVFKYPGTCECS